MIPIKITSPFICKLASLLNGSTTGVDAITLFPFIFSREDIRRHELTLIHEMVHFYQQIECLIIFFYLIYAFEFLYFRFWKKQSALNAYYSIRFEEEAYNAMFDKDYLSKRKWFAWTKIKL